MIGKASILGCLAFLLASAACGLEFHIPGVDIQLGFGVHVVPGPKDTSQSLCLVVTADKAIGDRGVLAVSGTITNYSGVPCDGVDMHFAVTSDIGSDTSLGRAVVEPRTIPAGGVATYKAFISLLSEKPHYAMYTITARSPALCGHDPGAVPTLPFSARELEGIPEP